MITKDKLFGANKMDNSNIRGKVILFGAGATGRGHVGLLCWQAGYELVFIDRNEELLTSLRDAGYYKVRLFGGLKGSTGYIEERIEGFRLYLHTQRDEIAEEIKNADLILTAVFDQNLDDVAKTLALAVHECRLAGRQRPLNVIACENMMDSSSTLGRHVLQQLNDDDREYFQNHFGFPDSMISRVVPRTDVDPLFIVTEDYNEWTVRREAFIGSPLTGLEKMELVDNQTARLERKLFIHNGGHAVCGFIGFHRGCHFIHEAVADPIVLRFVSGALDEIGLVVQKKHGFDPGSIDEYKHDLARRGSIAELKDDVLRVVRDPIRKLSSHERLVAPALLAVEYNLPRKWIVRGIVAAFHYCHPKDPQSIELRKMMLEDGLDDTLFKVCGISPESPLFEEIKGSWEEWGNHSLEELI
jgi:mannitol-1-phosphate 5-dehydrogenase